MEDIPKIQIYIDSENFRFRIRVRAIVKVRVKVRLRVQKDLGFYPRCHSELFICETYPVPMID